MMTNKSIVYEKAYRFSIEVVKAYKMIVSKHKEYDLARQFLRSGTSIGANIAEANGAISNADFSSKISIAYKECLEVKYWIDLLTDTQYLEKPMHDLLFNKADEIAKILFSILKSTRISPLDKKTDY